MPEPTNYPALLADIGGTNARFSLLDAAGAAPRRIATLKTGAYPRFEDAAKAAMTDTGAIVSTLLVAAAGPLQNGEILLTNAAWHLRGEEIRQSLGLATMRLFNDFEALALALADLDAPHTVPLGPVAREGARKGPRIVIGPGTGLGVAALIPVGDRWMPLASEAGHISIGPFDADEAAFWPHLAKVEGQITAEALVSGPGLLRLHNALRATQGQLPLFSSPDALSDAALMGDLDAIAAVQVFFDLLARLAGDMALAFKATGGVFIGGGILPRLARLLDQAHFRDRFERTASYTAFLAEIPLWLITAQNATELGLAALCHGPERFLVGSSQR